jgi:hypothetical protein
VTANDDDAELRALIGRIEVTFGADIDAWLQCFARPMVVVSPVGTFTFADDNAAKRQFQPMFDALAARGFASTTADTVVVRSIADDIALVDASFTRRHVDGSVLERVGALYVCRRDGGRWVAATLIGHPADRSAFDG